MGGTGGTRATHFRRHEGKRGAEGSALLTTLQTHSTTHTRETLQSEYMEPPANMVKKHPQKGSKHRENTSFVRPSQKQLNVILVKQIHTGKIT